MAKLCSDNQDCPSFLELSAAKYEERQGHHERWQHVGLSLQSGTKSVSTLNTDTCLLCRTPVDEMTKLIENLAKLAAGSSSLVFFEPNEPSFELRFERAHGNAIKVEAWLDASNASTGIYAWDACGIRFYTNNEQLLSFVEALRQEFTI